MMGAARAMVVVSCLLALAACNREQRVLDSDQPVTDPVGPSDPRVSQYQANAYQVSQGGRYFSLYGCGGCHGESAKGALDLGDPLWVHGGSADRIYTAIGAHGMLGARILPEQRWQLAAYVGQLPQIERAQRRRQDLDASGEAQGASWPGPVR